MRGQSGLCDQLHLRRRNAVVLIDNVVTEFNAPPGLIYLTKVANSSSARNVGRHQSGSCRGQDDPSIWTPVRE